MPHNELNLEITTMTLPAKERPSSAPLAKSVPTAVVPMPHSEPVTATAVPKKLTTKKNCIFLVSMNAPEYFEGEKLTAMLRHIKDNYSKCIPLLTDTLHRFNAAGLQEGAKDLKLHEQKDQATRDKLVKDYAEQKRVEAAKVGDEWLARNEPLFNEILGAGNYHVLRWNQLVGRQTCEVEFLKALPFKDVFTAGELIIQELASGANKKSPDFIKDREKTVIDFRHRRRTKMGVEPFKRIENHFDYFSQAFLDEECAGMNVMDKCLFPAGYADLVYPQSATPALAFMVRELKDRNKGTGISWEHCRVKVKKAKNAAVDSKWDVVPMLVAVAAPAPNNNKSSTADSKAMGSQAVITAVVSATIANPKPILWCVHGNTTKAETYQSMQSFLPEAEVQVQNGAEANALTELCKKQPKGPYYLFAYSSEDAALVLKLAQQLESKGEMVKRVFLLDAIAPVPDQKYSVHTKLQCKVNLYSSKGFLAKLTAGFAEIGPSLGWDNYFDEERITNRKISGVHDNALIKEAIKQWMGTVQRDLNSKDSPQYSPILPPANSLGRLSPTTLSDTSSLASSNSSSSAGSAPLTPTGHKHSFFTPSAPSSPEKPPVIQLSKKSNLSSETAAVCVTLSPAIVSRQSAAAPSSLYLATDSPVRLGESVGLPTVFSVSSSSKDVMTIDDDLFVDRDESAAGKDQLSSSVIFLSLG